jgi:hypothetical protein
LDSGLLKFFHQVFKKEKVELYKRLLIFSFFLVVSSIFWLLMELSKEYTTNISFPVIYKNLPQNKIISGQLPRQLDIAVHSYGFKLLQNLTFGNELPIVVDVADFTRKTDKHHKSIKYFLNINKIQYQISRQLSNELKIVDIKPDSLKFQVEEYLLKKVPVRADIRYSLEKQFMLKGKIRFVPDSVMVSGPEKLMDTISGVWTEYKNLEELNAPLTQSFSLKKIPSASFSIGSVVLKINVEKYTENTLSIPVDIINIPKGSQISVYPDKVSVTYCVGLSDYLSVKAYQFKFEANYAGSEKSKSRIKVVLARFPENVSHIRFQPKFVKYFIRK